MCFIWLKFFIPCGWVIEAVEKPTFCHGSFKMSVKMKIFQKLTRQRRYRTALCRASSLYC